MTSRRTKLISTISVAALAATGYFVYSVFATQGQGTLAQAPLNFQSQITPGFIMATDDSGSMTYQNQFPGADGKACWSRDSNGQPYSFFYTSGSNAGKLRTSGGTCNFAYSYGAHYRLHGGNYLGIPPVDTFGFARSHQFNPAYFDPTVNYLPWKKADGSSYENAIPTAALIGPTGTLPAVLETTVDLTVPNTETRDTTSNGRLSDKFRLLKDMTLPAGVEYTRLGSACGNLQEGTHTLSEPLLAGADCDVYIKHYLPTFFLTESTPVPPGYEGVARELVANACGAGCNMFRYTISASDTQAMQNFANWFSYYGNRHKALVAGLTHSLVDVNNMRIGYFRISQHGSFDSPNLTSALNPGSGGERVHMRNMEVPGDKAAIYEQVLGNPGWSSTYNRQAVYAAGQQFKRTDALNSTRGGAPVQLACQKNAMMLFTDGYSNSNGPTVDNVDGEMGVPFEDDHSNTLADIATAYYLSTSSGQSPLRTDLPAGQVRAPSVCPSTDPSVDCETNLHVNFYGITLGGRGNLYNPDSLPDPYSPAVYTQWPARQNDNRSTVDDIWHAAINTRGELVNARTPADITAAMRRILGSVSEGTTPAGSIGLTGARIGEGTLSVEPFYESRNFATDWYSTLTAEKPVADPITGAVTYTPAWEASARLPEADARTNVWYAKGTSVDRFVPTAPLTLADLCSSPASHSLCTDEVITSKVGVDIAEAITYLLGDQTNEEGRGGTDKLRFRTTRLGSIINSSPVFSAPTDDYGYRALRNETTGAADRFGYADYLETKSERHPMVYVGANDGMLHAFDGRSDGNGGRERLAYIPSTALGHMGNLLLPLAGKENDPDFKHRYFVDGPVTVADAHHASSWGGGGSGWKTVLVGTAGAGGRSVFALDVSDPTGFTAGSRLWEIGPHSANAVQRDLGYVLGKPVIVPVKNSAGAVRWKAIFGNGYNSPNGNAVLFVVDVATGTVQRVQANETDPPAGGTNGLGNIVAVDRFSKRPDDGSLTLPGRDGYADTVYAADQKGAIWKFDLRPATPTPVTQPTFVTRTYEDGSRQPILGGLTAALAPGGGVMVYFGTGSFSFLGDKEDTTVQSLYGVMDRNSPDTLTRSDLTAQTVTVGATGSTSRDVTREPLGVGSRGWYVDLPAGERAVSNPRIENGIVFIPTYDPVASQGCSGLGNNWLYGLNALTGGAGLSGVTIGSPTGDPYGSATGAVALATGGTAPVKDVAVMTTPRLQPLAAGATEAELDEALASQCSMLVQVAGAPALFMRRACGRQSWRQIR